MNRFDLFVCFMAFVFMLMIDESVWYERACAVCLGWLFGAIQRQAKINRRSLDQRINRWEP